MIRLLDVLISIIALVVLLPMALVIAIAIAVNSRGGVLFKQVRTGKNGKPFNLLKFRTMVQGAHRGSQLTVGADARITSVGRRLRASKLDELPQLVNVLLGDMSLVGPRPEVPAYTERYTEAQREVLRVRPGITDEASLAYFNESDLLATSANPEALYLKEVMPAKINLNLPYVRKPSIRKYFSVLWRTAKRVASASTEK